MMESSDEMENINRADDARLNDASSPDGSSGRKDTLPDMLRIKQQMANQCFEIAVQLHAGKSDRSCSSSQAERDLPEYINELERLRTLTFNSTLTLHRMQIWEAMEEQLKQNDDEANALKAMAERYMALCSQVKQLQQEVRDLQNETTEIQKKRLEVKRLIHEKMKEMEEEMVKKEHPDREKYKATLKKGLENLEKYKIMATMTQNVLRGILLACKINWLDDPAVRDVALTLEELPISD